MPVFLVPMVVGGYYYLKNKKEQQEEGDNNYPPPPQQQQQQQPHEAQEIVSDEGSSVEISLVEEREPQHGKFVVAAEKKSPLTALFSSPHHKSNKHRTSNTSANTTADHKQRILDAFAGVIQNQMLKRKVGVGADRVTTEMTEERPTDPVVTDAEDVEIEPQDEQDVGAETVPVATTCSPHCDVDQVKDFFGEMVECGKESDVIVSVVDNRRAISVASCY